MTSKGKQVTITFKMLTIVAFDQRVYIVEGGLTCDQVFFFGGGEEEGKREGGDDRRLKVA